MQLASWFVAWDRYALAAAMTGQISFGEAQGYKTLVGRCASASACMCGVICPCLSGGVRGTRAAHRVSCMRLCQVAALSRAEKRTPTLAVIYDDFLRRVRM